MVHTKDGSRVVREFLARGNAKVSNTSPSPLVHPSQLATPGPKTNSQSIKATHRTHVSRRRSPASPLHSTGHHRVCHFQSLITHLSNWRAVIPNYSQNLSSHPSPRSYPPPQNQGAKPPRCTARRKAGGRLSTSSPRGPAAISRPPKSR